ncbi:MAG: glycosyltransferase family 1 protein [Burkholderiales bacterium]|nr:MAG: glycosyltransferase family 1 protein [Burkholderiales bacterium]
MALSAQRAERRLRVLHLRSSAGLYGAEQVLLTLLPELPALGVDVVLGCLRNPYQPSLALHERALALGVDSRLVPCRGRFDPGTVGAIRELADALEVDAIHVHDYKSVFHARLANRPRRPLVATLHGHFADTPSVRFYNWIELALVRGADRVCIVSDAMREGLLRRRIDPARTVTVPNGVDTVRYRPGDAAAARAALGLPADARVFGTAMRLAAPKFPIGLVEAFAAARARLGPATLMVIAGDGPMRAELESRIAALDLGDSVRLLGVRDDLERVYPALDAFVLPSLSEGLPMALLEAMACGVPPIATAVGRVPEVIAGVAQAPLPPGDVGAFAEALVAFAPRPGAADALRSRVLERYGAGGLARAYADVYRGLRGPASVPARPLASPGA